MMSAKRKVRQKMEVKPNRLDIRPTMKMLWKKVRTKNQAKVRKRVRKPKHRVRAGNILTLKRSLCFI